MHAQCLYPGIDLNAVRYYNRHERAQMATGAMYNSFLTDPNFSYQADVKQLLTVLLAVWSVVVVWHLAHDILVMVMGFQHG